MASPLFDFTLACSFFISGVEPEHIPYYFIVLSCHENWFVTCLSWIFLTVRTKPKCVPNPCMNDGVCTAFLHDYECTCSIGFMGRHCEGKQDLCADRYDRGA